MLLLASVLPDKHLLGKLISAGPCHPLALVASLEAMPVWNKARLRSLCLTPPPPAGGSAGQKDFCWKKLFLHLENHRCSRRNIPTLLHFAPPLFQHCSPHLGLPSKVLTFPRQFQIFLSLNLNWDFVVRSPMWDKRSRWWLLKIEDSKGNEYSTPSQFMLWISQENLRFLKMLNNFIHSLILPLCLLVASCLVHWRTPVPYKDSLSHFTDFIFES